jgi:hypothetical protein
MVSIGTAPTVPAFEYILADKYSPTSNTWGLCVAGSNCSAYNVAGRSDLKLIVGRDGSFKLYSRRSEDAIALNVSSGSPGSILLVDPVTGRPPGAVVRQGVEENNPLWQNESGRDRRHIRRRVDARSEAVRQWAHVVDTFFPDSPIGRVTTPPDSFIDLFREEHESAPEPEPPREEPATRAREERSVPHACGDEPKEERPPTRFELIEF